MFKIIKVRFDANTSKMKSNRNYELLLSPNIWWKKQLLSYFFVIGAPKENLFLMFLSNLSLGTLWIGEIWHYLKIVAIKLWTDLTLTTLCTSEKHSISGNTEGFVIFYRDRSPQENLFWMFPEVWTAGLERNCCESF